MHRVIVGEMVGKFVDGTSESRTPEEQALIHTIPISCLDEVADAVTKDIERARNRSRRALSTPKAAESPSNLSIVIMDISLVC